MSFWNAQHQQDDGIIQELESVPSKTMGTVKCTSMPVKRRVESMKLKNGTITPGSGKNKNVQVDKKMYSQSFINHADDNRRSKARKRKSMGDVEDQDSGKISESSKSDESKTIHQTRSSKAMEDRIKRKMYKR